MRAILLIGSSDKAQSEYALSVAKENDYTLIAFAAKEFPQHEKDFFTGTLDNRKCLFHLFDAHKLNFEESEKLFKIIEESPQRFILSGPPETPWFVKKFCIMKPLDNSMEPLTEQLKILLTEPNRHLVRKYLKDADILHLFHILKYGAWQNPQTLEWLSEMSRNLYKVNRNYLLSMLCMIPAKPYAIGSKRNMLQPQEISIMKKLKTCGQHSKNSEIADTYLLMKICKSLVDKIEFSDVEKKFLGIEEKPVEEQVFAKAVSIEEFF